MNEEITEVVATHFIMVDIIEMIINHIMMIKDIMEMLAINFIMVIKEIREMVVIQINMMSKEIIEMMAIYFIVIS